MCAARCLAQIDHRAFRHGAIPKNVQADCADFFAGWRLGNDTPKNCAHREHFLLKAALKFFRGGKSKTQSQSSQLIGAGRNGVSLFLRFNLQPMLRSAKKAIRALKIDNFLSRDQLEFAEAVKRLQGIRLLQKCVSRAVDELECLHDEFNFADPTTAEFHIPAEPALSDNIAFDPSF